MSSYCTSPPSPSSPPDTAIPRPPSPAAPDQSPSSPPHSSSRQPPPYSPPGTSLSWSRESARCLPLAPAPTPAPAAPPCIPSSLPDFSHARPISNSSQTQPPRISDSAAAKPSPPDRSASQFSRL